MLLNSIIFGLTFISATLAIDTYICENTVDNLNCPSGQVLDISKALYGRDNPTKCSINNETINHNCTFQDVTEIFAGACNGAQNCSFFFNSTEDDVLDPCRNISRYVSLTLNCIEKVARETHFCENTVDNLNCPTDQVIDISKALYGRDNSTICSTNENVNNQNCTFQDVTGIFAGACNGAQNCSLFFNTTDYDMKDPCENVTKYLSLTVECIKPVSEKLCGPHAQYTPLVCDCLNKCSTPGLPCMPFCSFRNGCMCNPGFREDPISGKCIGAEFCPQGILIQTHEEYSHCANHQRTCRRFGFERGFSRKCVPGYVCKMGYVRDTFSGECVLPDQCPTLYPGI